MRRQVQRSDGWRASFKGLAPERYVQRGDSHGSPWAGMRYAGWIQNAMHGRDVPEPRVYVTGGLATLRNSAYALVGGGLCQGGERLGHLCACAGHTAAARGVSRRWASGGCASGRLARAQEPIETSPRQRNAARFHGDMTSACGRRVSAVPSYNAERSPASVASVAHGEARTGMKQLGRARTGVRGNGEQRDRATQTRDCGVHGQCSRDGSRGLVLGEAAAASNRAQMSAADWEGARRHPFAVRPTFAAEASALWPAARRGPPNAPLNSPSVDEALAGRRWPYGAHAAVST